MVKLNRDSRIVTVTVGKRVFSPAMTPREFDLALAIAEAKPSVVTRQTLLERVFGHPKGANVDTRTVDQHIARFRNKLGPEASKCIRTVTNHGYAATSLLTIEDPRPSLTMRVLDFNHKGGKKPDTHFVVSFGKLIPTAKKGATLEVKAAWVVGA